jgi:hypothetical protein
MQDHDEKRMKNIQHVANLLKNSESDGVGQWAN